MQFSSAVTVWSGFLIFTSYTSLDQRKSSLAGLSGYVSRLRLLKFYCLICTLSECTSNVSSLLTTLNGSINVFIYFFKHHEFVIGLIFPRNQNSDSFVPAMNSSRRRRSSWMLHRNPSKPIPLYMSSALPSPSPSRSTSPYASNTLIESNTTSAPSFVDYFSSDQIRRENMTEHGQQQVTRVWTVYRVKNWFKGLELYLCSWNINVTLALILLE